MYARTLHRATVVRISRRRPVSLSQRFFASVGSASGANPSPDTSSEPIKNLESWTSVVGTSPNGIPPFQLPGDGSLKESSEALLSCDEVARDDHPTRRSASPTTASSSICVVPELRALHMPGILSLVREFEQRFGRIREFRTLRDKDSPADFMKALFVTFYDKESVEKIQSTLRGRRTGTITVGPPPELDRLQQMAGGVGLEDVQALLRPGNVELPAAEAGIENRLIMEETVNMAEKTSESTERNVDDRGGDRSDRESPASSVDTCECHIEILMDKFQSAPLLNDRDRVRASTQQQAHISRSLVHWAGFYPHYRFAPSYDEDKGTEGYDKLSDAEEHRTNTVHLATRDLRDMIIRHRTRLHSFGQADHGISFRGGRPIVLEWELPPQLEETQGTPARDPVEGGPPVGRVREAIAEMRETMMPTEDESSKQPPPSDDVRAQLNTRPISNSTNRVRGPRRAIPSSPSSARSNGQDASASSPPSLTSGRPPEGAASAKSMTRADIAAAGVSEMRITENNRARRSRKKAEQERAGFKAKLLGWLGR